MNIGGGRQGKLRDGRNSLVLFDCLFFLFFLFIFHFIWFVWNSFWAETKILGDLGFDNHEQLNNSRVKRWIKAVRDDGDKNKKDMRDHVEKTNRARCNQRCNNTLGAPSVLLLICRDWDVMWSAFRLKLFCFGRSSRWNTREREQWRWKGNGVLHTTTTTKYIYLIQIDTLLRGEMYFVVSTGRNAYIVSCTLEREKINERIKTWPGPPISFLKLRAIKTKIFRKLIWGGWVKPIRSLPNRSKRGLVVGRRRPVLVERKRARGVSPVSKLSGIRRCRAISRPSPGTAGLSSTAICPWRPGWIPWRNRECRWSCSWILPI